MELVFLEPLESIIFDGRVIKGIKVKEKTFGGFCECGGVMYQKMRFIDSKTGILVSECDKCWKNDALIISMLDGRVMDRADLKLVDRSNFPEFLKKILSESEFKAVIAKAYGKEYNPSSYSKAKRKLEEMNLEISTILSII